MALSAIPLGENGSMMRRGLFITAMGALALGACGSSDEASYRFRMTVEADTPEGRKTGSSVMEISARREPQLTSEARALAITLRGQAVEVQLPSGPVFALLELDHGRFNTLEEAVTYALEPDIKPGGWEPFWKAVNRLGGWFSSAEVELPREDWPMMVRFRDLNDPASVDRVDPESAGIRRILVETTSDEVTTGIADSLPWLTRLHGGYLHGGFSSRGAPLGLDGTAFSTEISHAE